MIFAKALIEDRQDLRNIASALSINFILRAMFALDVKKKGWKNDRTPPPPAKRRLDHRLRAELAAIRQARRRASAAL